MSYIYIYIYIYIYDISNLRVKLAQMTLRLGYGLNDRRFEVRFQTGARDCVWIGCGAHPAYCPKGPSVISLRAQRQDPEANHSLPTLIKCAATHLMTCASSWSDAMRYLQEQIYLYLYLSHFEGNTLLLQ